MDDDFHMRAAELLYNWATDDGNWVTQEAADSIGDKMTVVNEVEAGSEKDAHLVYDRWEDIWAEVADRIELEIAESA